MHMPGPAAVRQRASGKVACLLDLPTHICTSLQLQATRGVRSALTPLEISVCQLLKIQELY